MLILIAKWTVLIFGVFIFAVGLLMLFDPKKARKTLRKAGSTNLINYAEITIRMIPAAGLILYSDLSRYPEFFKLMGWVMIITSVVLYFIPRRLHHNFSLYCADILKPVYFQLISPVAVLFGLFIIYSVT